MVGLIPGIGDFSGTILSGYIILASARLGVPPSVLVRMLLNVAVDTGIGSIPVLGDVFDVAWRANIKNADLLEKHLAPGQTRDIRKVSRGALLIVFVGLLLLATGTITISVLLFRALARLAT